MSTRIMSECWPLPMSPTQKAVLISLADQANDHGVCWPSVGSVAMRTCLSERAVRKSIRDLEQMGHVKSNGRSGTSSYYTITPAPDAAPARDSAPAVPAPTPAPDAGGGGTSCRGPRHEVPPNRKEPSVNHQEPSESGARAPDENPKKRRKSGPKAKLTKTDLINDFGIPEELAVQFLQIRKDKRLTLTPIAMNDLVGEFEKAGMTVQEGIAFCCRESWAAFKNSWNWRERIAQNGPPKSFTETDYSKGVTADGRLS